MAGKWGKDGRQRSGANAVWQTRREIPVEVFRLCGGEPGVRRWIFSECRNTNQSTATMTVEM
jgi:hypothetical protein